MCIQAHVYVFVRRQKGFKVAKICIRLENVGCRSKPGEVATQGTEAGGHRHGTRHALALSAISLALPATSITLGSGSGRASGASPAPALP